MKRGERMIEELGTQLVWNDRMMEQWEKDGIWVHVHGCMCSWLEIQSPLAAGWEEADLMLRRVILYVYVLLHEDENSVKKRNN